MDTELSAALTTAESNELSSLTIQLSDNNKRLLIVSREKNDSKTERDKQQVTLENNLLKRAAALEELLSTRITEEQNDQIERINNELQTTIASLSNKETELSDIDDKIIKHKQSLKSTQDKIEIQKKIEHDTMVSVNRESRSVENSLAKRSAALQKREEALRQIHELGSLPTDLQKYKNLSSEECLKKLKTISDKLQKYKKVNKKALDQYVAFTEQRQDLFVRKEEAEQGRIAIEELIKTLDNKKEEAIQRTFKSIGKSFSEVFSQLVPGGKASLIIRTKRTTDENADDKKKNKKNNKKKQKSNKRLKRSKDEEEENDDEEEEEEGGEEEEDIEEREATMDIEEKKNVDDEAPSIRQYAGVGIRVSFTGAAHQEGPLSGGQESIVALAFIFAIQKADPSPFYIFDEIDAALDPVHRTSVAQMIKRTTKDTNAQFIMTTFHQELMQVGDKYYGVKFQNRQSIVNVIDEERATQLIQAEDRQARLEEAEME